MTKLSVTIITRNEEADLDAALASVSAVADEIILVDSGSTDKTLDIAKRHGAKIFAREWTGYSDQKQFALEKADGPWVLNIDADERLSDSLVQEIKTLLRMDPVAACAYRIPFKNFFLGRPLRFGRGASEWHVRLFLKEGAAYGTSPVHEGIQIQGSVKRLTHPILHYSYRSISDYLDKCDRYTTMIAEKKFAAGQRFHWWQHLRLPYEFLSRYVFRAGFLDGAPGLLYAGLSSFYVWLKYIKLWELENRSKEKK